MFVCLCICVHVCMCVRACVFVCVFVCVLVCVVFDVLGFYCVCAVCFGACERVYMCVRALMLHQKKLETSTCATEGQRERACTRAGSCMCLHVSRGVFACFVC